MLEEDIIQCSCLTSFTEYWQSHGNMSVNRSDRQTDRQTDKQTDRQTDRFFQHNKEINRAEDNYDIFDGFRPASTSSFKNSPSCVI